MKWMEKMGDCSVIDTIMNLFIVIVNYTAHCLLTGAISTRRLLNDSHKFTVEKSWGHML